MIGRGVLTKPSFVGPFCRSVGAQSTTQLWHADPLHSLIHLGYNMVVTLSRYGVGKPFQNRDTMYCRRTHAACLFFFVRQFGCTAAAFFGKEEMPHSSARVLFAIGCVD